MKRLLTIFSSAVVSVVALAGTAVAQNAYDPGIPPERVEAPWIVVVAWAVLGLSVLATFATAALYMRWKSKSSAAMEDEDAILRPVLAPKVQLGAVAPRPPAPAPVAVGSFSAAAAPATAAQAAAAPPAPAVAAPAVAAVAPATAAPAEAAPAVAVAEKKVEVEPDQETFDRVLAEQLDKGVDRRVAEGRAKSAAVKAARAKAGG